MAVKNNIYNIITCTVIPSIYQKSFANKFVNKLLTFYNVLYFISKNITKKSIERSHEDKSSQNLATQPSQTQSVLYL